MAEFGSNGDTSDASAFQIRSIATITGEIENIETAHDLTVQFRDERLSRFEDTAFRRRSDSVVVGHIAGVEITFDISVFVRADDQARH